ncbi:hypothetical protein GC209_00060 [bacterium]|nr:hypothetical protein [bacterium]
MTPRKPMLDPDHPMFSKAWVRWVTTVAPLAWGGAELWNGNAFWGVLFVAAGVYAGWKLLIYKP